MNEASLRKSSSSTRYTDAVASKYITDFFVFPYTLQYPIPSARLSKIYSPKAHCFALKKASIAVGFNEINGNKKLFLSDDFWEFFDSLIILSHGHSSGKPMPAKNRVDSSDMPSCAGVTFPAKCPR